MPLDSPETAGALAYLMKRHPVAVALAAPENSPRPYDQLGSHPDIVARLWDQLNPALPVDCRCILYGTPALLRQDTRNLLGFALGTQYCLYLPAGLAELAVRAGAQTSTRWAGGSVLDLRQTFGQDWVFGRFLPEEADWLNQVYRSFDPTDS